MTSDRGSDNSSGTGNAVLGASTNMININTASESDLDALSGIGPVTAQKIISNRPYQSTQDLVPRRQLERAYFLSKRRGSCQTFPPIRLAASRLRAVGPLHFCHPTFIMKFSKIILIIALLGGGLAEDCFSGGAEV